MNNDEFKSLPLGRLVFLCLVIAGAVALGIQNFRPLVVLYFLGQATMPIPLSLAMLAAFIGGAFSAGLINLIANWLQQRRLEAFKNSVDYNPSRSPNSPPPAERFSKTEKIAEDEDTYEYPPKQANSKYEEEEEYDEYEEDEEKEDRVIEVKYINKDFKKYS